VSAKQDWLPMPHLCAPYLFLCRLPRYYRCFGHSSMALSEFDVVAVLARLVGFQQVLMEG
jgi:hypothetical protein